MPSSVLALGLRIADIADAIDENTDSSDEKRMMAIGNVIAKNTENGAILSMFDLCIKVTRAQRTDEAEVMEIVRIAFGHTDYEEEKGRARTDDEDGDGEEDEEDDEEYDEEEDDGEEV